MTSSNQLGAEERLVLRSALLRECSPGRPSDDLIERLVESVTDPDEAEHLARLRGSRLRAPDLTILFGRPIPASTKTLLEVGHALDG